MAAKKSAKKTPAKKKAAVKKAPAKKRATTKKAGPKRKTGTKRTATGKKAAVKRKPVARDAARKVAPASQPAAPVKPTKPESNVKNGISSLNVNMGQIIALRPRVSTSFRQPDFLDARRALEDESYDSPDEAARAVAEKALALTQTGGPAQTFRHKRRRR